jgi:hypothetical protein
VLFRCTEHFFEIRSDLSNDRKRPGVRLHTRGGETRMSQSGYQIRHELLCEARLILFDAWSQKCENIRRNADLSKTRSDLPSAPTVADVKAVAEQLYAFVERR